MATAPALGRERCAERAGGGGKTWREAGAGKRGIRGKGKEGAGEGQVEARGGVEWHRRALHAGGECFNQVG